MTKAELINVIADKSGLTKKDSEKAVTAFIESVTEILVSGDKISLVGFGTFETKSRAERLGINPATKAPMTIPATTVPVFKAGKALKDAVAKK